MSQNSCSFSELFVNILVNYVHASVLGYYRIFIFVLSLRPKRWFFLKKNQRKLETHLGDQMGL
jgi:hypothetical protein